eukprot:jgi/Botrbrau1/14615/Bobra.67_2s0015.1
MKLVRQKKKMTMVRCVVVGPCWTFPINTWTVHHCPAPTTKWDSINKKTPVDLSPGKQTCGHPCDCANKPRQQALKQRHGRESLGDKSANITPVHAHGSNPSSKLHVAMGPWQNNEHHPARILATKPKTHQPPAACGNTW